MNDATCTFPRILRLHCFVTHVCICLHHFASCLILHPAACSCCPDWGLPCPRPLTRATAAVHPSPLHGWRCGVVCPCGPNFKSKNHCGIKCSNSFFGHCPTCRGYLDFFHNPWRQATVSSERCTSQYLYSFANRSFHSSGILSV